MGLACGSTAAASLRSSRTTLLLTHRRVAAARAGAEELCAIGFQQLAFLDSRLGPLPEKN